MYVIIETGDHTKIKTQEKARIGLPGHSAGKLVNRE